MDDRFEGGYSDSTIEESDNEGSARIGTAAAAPPVETEAPPEAAAPVEAVVPVEAAAPAVVEVVEAVVRPMPINETAGTPNANITEQEKDESELAEPQAKCMKRSRDSDDDDADDEDSDSRRICPICMDVWTNSGSHRLVCLRCGHLFGYSCIVRWLEVGCSTGQRRCPQCNKKASKKDIRTLYVHNLLVLDTTESDKLKEEIEVLKQDKNRLEMELARVSLNNKLHQDELKQALSKIQLLESKAVTLARSSGSSDSSQHAVTRMALETALEISNSGGCRVLAYSALLNLLCVSQNSPNNLFSGFGVRKVDVHNVRPIVGQCTILHSKAIRDLAFRPQSNDLLLSVSLDKTAKLLDMSTNSIINKFVTDHPLWSCCWDAENLNKFFIGSQNGSVLQYDSRQPNSPLNRLTFPGDLSPVTSLVSLAHCAGRFLPRGGLLVSKLVSCWAYGQNNAEYQGQQLPLEGPFTSMCYDQETENVLISVRPNARNPNICHVVCQLEKDDNIVVCNPVHTFLGGTAHMQLSRPCLVKMPHDTLVAAYLGSSNSISTWSISSGQTISTVKAYDPIKDLCPIEVSNKHFLASLSEKTLRIYSMNIS